MKFFWIIPFFLLQDTEAFLMKNAKVKLCLQASPMDGSLLLEDCNPESDFQDWSWQGDSLMNHGTQSCLSVAEADRVQTSLCGSTGYMSWDCSNSLLSPLGSSQGYLVANKKGVALNNVRGLKAQWQDVANRSVCEEKAAEAEQDRYFTAALASTHMYDPTTGNVTLALGIDQVKLEELLWFFRREDPSTWNYSILALSFVAMILGLLLLSINVVRNRSGSRLEANPCLPRFSSQLVFTRGAGLLRPSLPCGFAPSLSRHLPPRNGWELSRGGRREAGGGRWEAFPAVSQGMRHHVPSGKQPR